ncbi:hypothetical protein [Holophaga foetida]|uniref:hypothetical protein n=1 Tax=Holophaga foetida TaxID=35839 RepID=UPI000247375B|nr:hypothetical protein [Holophaga foetida]
MKTRLIKGTLLTVMAVASLGMTLGCLIRPIGPGGMGGRDRGDRYESEDSGRRGRDRDRDRHHSDGDRDQRGDRDRDEDRR